MPRPTTGMPCRRSRPCWPARTSTSKSRSPTTSPRAQAMIAGGPEDQQDHGRRHPAAVVDPLSEGRRDRPLGQARQGLLGPDLELREHQPDRHGQVPRRRGAVVRRLRALARARARARVQPQPVPPPVPLVLRLCRRHDERLGRAPERHRALGTRCQGPADGLDHRRHLHHRRRPRHPRHHAGRLRVPRAARSPTRCARATV